ncbi:MAG: methyltransferase domain-containing protein [Polyangiaceae bacterium]
MTQTDPLEATRAYYDEFSERYEAARRPNDPYGYHALIDDLEIEYATRFCAGKDVLEAGCGTGLVLEKLARVARNAEGFDLSPGMLSKARERGLTVKEGSLTEIPYEDATFDVCCSFKVLAHVPEIEKALREMARVVRPGGYVLAEFYNPYSLRALAKKFGPAGAISDRTYESAVYTRFDSPSRVREIVPAGCSLVGSRGVRIVTPAAKVMKHPKARYFFTTVERALADSKLSRFGGFWIAAIRRDR